MKMQLTILLAAMVVTSAGCTEAATRSPIPTATQTVEASLPSLSPSPTLAPIPTLAAENAYPRLLELLQNNAGCSLPCLWGITPGISTNSDVQNLILPFAGVAEMSRLPSSIFGGMIFNILMKDDSRINLFLSYYPSSDSRTINAIYLSAQAFHNHGKPDQDLSFYGSDLYAKILNSYTLHGILSTYGTPADAFVFVEKYSDPGSSSNFFLRILYPEKGIFVSYQLLVEEHAGSYWGCPSKAFISLYLLPANGGITYQQILPSIDGQWNSVFPINHSKSLDEAVHMSLDDFYQIFKNPTDRCLETPMSMWDRP